jgi:hypothetical protein
MTITEAQMSSNRGGLTGDAFLKTTITADDIGVVVHDGEPFLQKVLANEIIRGW